MKRAALVLLVICLAVYINAAAASAAVELSVTESPAGDTAAVTVSISGNPGIAHFKFKLDYDKAAYTPVSIQSGEAITSGTVLSNIQSSGNDAPEYVTAQWFDAYNIDSDGELFTITFTVKAKSPVPFSLSYNTGDIINQDLENVSLTISDGTQKTPDTPVETENPPDTPEIPPEDEEETETPQDSSEGSPSTGNPSAGSPSTGNPAQTDVPGGGIPSGLKQEPESEADLLFSDIGGYEWAIDAITTLASKGIVKGTGDSTFSPASNTRRADYMLMIVRLLGLDTEFTDNFDDVTPDAYYYREIGIAKAAGLTSGTGDNKFSPDSFITRQDMFVIAYRIFSRQGLNEAPDITVLEQFDDSGNVSDYASEALAVLIQSGWVKGNDNRIEPLSLATRAEMAVFVHRIYEFINAS